MGTRGRTRRNALMPCETVHFGHPQIGEEQRQIMRASRDGKRLAKIARFQNFDRRVQLAEYDA